jgi:glycosyltransferase involved in cell wall biosynthesis
VHVGVVLTNYPPHLGGVEAHVQALAGELVRAGHAVTVVCLADDVPHRTDEDRAGVRVLTLRRRLDVGGVLAVPARTDWAAATAALGAAGLSHLSVHTRYFPMTWLGLRLARRLGVPALLTEHGGGHVATASPATTAAARAVDVTAGRRALRTADSVVAVSATAAAFVRRLSGRDAAVLGNGSDTAFWSAARSTPRRHLVFAGRLVAEKGWHEALSCLAAAPQDVTATVAGDGPDRAAVQRAIRTLGLDGRVTVAGRLDRTQLRAAFAGSVYVNPSVAAEGFQTTLLEAGLAGARIATYDVGGAAEVVGSGGAVGRVVRVGDTGGLRRAVRDLLDDTTTAEVSVLKRYDWPAVADRFVEELAATTVGRTGR